jgi:hypothetical protein
MVAVLPVRRLSDLHWGVVSDAQALRAVQVRLGKRLLELRRIDRFTLFETTTFSLYCEKVGVSASEGRSLADLAEAGEKAPEVVSSVLEGQVTLSQAGMVAEVAKRPDLQRPGDDWLRWAREGTTADLRRFLDRRKEEVRSGGNVLSMELQVSEKGCIAFRRCRDLVSRSVGSTVTPGQALETVCEDYLERHDPEREAERLREKDEVTKASLKGSGSEPSWRDGKRVALTALTRREVLRRFGDRCWVKRCQERVHFQNAHLRPVRAGGSNFPWNLARLCFLHHKQYDAGLWFLVEKRDGTVELFDQRGVSVGELVHAAVEAAEHPPP